MAANNPQLIRVAVVEDRPDTQGTLVELLNTSPGLRCVGAWSSGEDALKLLPAAEPEIVLVDIQLPGISGIELLPRLRAVCPKAHFMVLTVLENHESIFAALRAGASGYLLKKTLPAKLIESIRELHGGGAPMSAPIARLVIQAFQAERAPDAQHGLSPRELDVVRGLAKGLIYKEIAKEMGITEGTIRTHIGKIYEKLHVQNRTQAVRRVFPNGLNRQV